MDLLDCHVKKPISMRMRPIKEENRPVSSSNRHLISALPMFVDFLTVDFEINVTGNAAWPSRVTCPSRSRDRPLTNASRSAAFVSRKHPPLGVGWDMAECPLRPAAMSYRAGIRKHLLVVEDSRTDGSEGATVSASVRLGGCRC